MIQQPLWRITVLPKRMFVMPYFIFIVNPTAGKGVHSESLCARIRSYFSTQNIDFEIYRTVGPQDALQFVRSYPARKDNVPICFVACGGDGTLHEVVNGAAGRTDCTVSVIPCGSGNDYVKNFGSSDAFTDLERLTSKWVIIPGRIVIPRNATAGIFSVEFSIFSSPLRSEKGPYT